MSRELNPIRAQKNPLALVSGYDEAGHEAIFVAQKSGRLDTVILKELRPNEVPVITSGIDHAEVQAIQAAKNAGVTQLLVGSRPNLVCVACEAYAINARVPLASPSRAATFLTELARLNELLGQ